jgi:uncharacterized YigZ family protein
VEEISKYITLQNIAVGEYKDKGSKFIAFAFPFNSDSLLKDKLEYVKKLHPKARHYCFAYKIGAKDGVFRTNDDGEPAGSAGKPIYNVILSQGLSDLIVIVVRYFGGTLLGVSGLINAYKNATMEALNSAAKIEVFLKKKIKLAFEFDKLNELMKIVKEYNLSIEEQQFNDHCEVTLSINLAVFKEVLSRINHLRFFKIEEIQDC